MTGALLTTLVWAAELTLVTFSFSLTYRAIGFANFAHVQFVTLGAYFAVTLHEVLPIPAAAALAAAGTGLVGVAMNLAIFRRMQADSSATRMIVSTGLALGIQALIPLIWGPNTRGFPLAPVDFTIAGTSVSRLELAVIASAVLSVVAFYLVLRHTRFGKLVRATADNRVLVQVRGVDANRVVTGVWFVAGAFAGLGGVFLGMQTVVQPLLGTSVLIPMFAAAIVGGLGSSFGAIAGALMLSALQTAALGIDFGHLVGRQSFLIDTRYKSFIAMAALAVVLLARPRGVLGETVTRA